MNQTMTAQAAAGHAAKGPKAHALAVRVSHWVGAAAMITMILSGWAIYNAAPILPFTFPPWMTLGGWLGAGIAWHISAMWVLMADGLFYLIWSGATGHFRRALWPVTCGGVMRDLRAALRLRLVHRSGQYNAVQKLLYILVIAGAVAAVLSGLAIWKPVQLGWLTWCLGGYDLARRIHFALMACIVAFLVVHLMLVALVPSTLLAMVTGGRRAPDAEQPR
jgi:thiosulfate reductase cytochrome b subunit